MAANLCPARAQILNLLAQKILAIPCPHPLRVGIDGIDAAGKTRLAEELVSLVETGGRPALRVSEDDFHRPRIERYRRGPDSSLGYFLDSFDTPAILTAVLLPLGPGGDRRYRPAVFDHRRDRRVPQNWQAASPGAVLLFDGIFLFRPEFNPYWDYRIFVQVRFKTSVERGCRRDLASPEPATLQALQQRYWRRYVAGQEIYLQAVHPEALADAILTNDDLDYPTLAFRPSSS